MGCWHIFKITAKLIAKCNGGQLVVAVQVNLTPQISIGALATARGSLLERLTLMPETRVRAVLLCIVSP